jgi:hypothetical protein
MATLNPTLRRYDDFVLARIIKEGCSVDEAVPAAKFISLPAPTSLQAAALAAFVVRPPRCLSPRWLSLSAVARGRRMCQCLPYSQWSQGSSSGVLTACGGGAGGVSDS